RAHNLGVVILAATLAGETMTGQLIESRAIRQRRTGGAAISTAFHLAIIAAAAAATRGTPIPHSFRPDPPVRLVRVADQPHDESRARPSEPTPHNALTPTIVQPTTAPTFTPSE